MSFVCSCQLSKLFNHLPETLGSDTSKLMCSNSYLGLSAAYQMKPNKTLLNFRKAAFAVYFRFSL